MWSVVSLRCICNRFLFVIFLFFDIIIIIIDLITLINIYLLGNLRLSQSANGIKLSQGEEIHPIP
jgi:hypothetical protein